MELASGCEQSPNLVVNVVRELHGYSSETVCEIPGVLPEVKGFRWQTPCFETRTMPSYIKGTAVEGYGKALSVFHGV